MRPPVNARQRRAAEIAASADKQAQLKQEAAARRAMRAKRSADESNRAARVDRGESAGTPTNPS
jgi:hypothetical protein